MKKNTKNSERGQALILIVFAVVGLVGLTALTVDGGNAYADRRHAQNAADTAAFAAARAKIRSEGWKAAALAMAGVNGYEDSDATSASSSTTVNVEVYQCTEAAASCGEYADEAYEHPEEYIQVLITTTIDTFFGKVIGVEQMTSKVNSVVRAKPGSPDPDSWGEAMTSTMPGCFGYGGWNHNPLTMGGNTTVNVTGSGVFVNADCSNALVENGGYTFNAAAGICVVGPIADPTVYHTSPLPQGDCAAPKPPPPVINPSCDNFIENGVRDPQEMGVITNPGGGSVYEATPGYYSGDFPTVSSGLLRLHKGIYCIVDNGSVTFNNIMTVTTDLDGGGIHDYATEGVLIMVVTGGIKMNGSSTLDLHAMSDPSVDPSIRNVLFYLPPGNTSPVTINGNSGSEFTGTILAPSSHVTMTGSAGGTGVNSQIIGYSLEFSGGGTLNLHYDQSQNMVILSPSSIELAE